LLLAAETAVAAAATAVAAAAAATTAMAAATTAMRRAVAAAVEAAAEAEALDHDEEFRTASTVSDYFEQQRRSGRTGLRRPL
jgi:hypothetical protein